MEGLLSVSEARQRLVDAISQVGVEKVPLSSAAGRILAEEAVSGLDLPPFDNSSMDGFALLAADIEKASRANPVPLQVIADIPAGKPYECTIERGQAARIMTGAPLPQGADAVVPVEDTDYQTRQPGMIAPDQVKIMRSVTPGSFVRSHGEDVHRGEVLLRPGCPLRPQDVGMLAMVGIDGVNVYQRPRVALLSTGDELVPVGQPLEPGKIYESNGYVLAALVKRCGGEPISLGIVADKANAVRSALDQAVKLEADLILSSAGVSVGAFDFVRSVVEEAGELNFWRVNMRPGKPLAFGHYRSLPFIGLPGNPVSAFVGFEVFVRPALYKAAGMDHIERPTTLVTLTEPVRSDGRETYLRAVVDLIDGRRMAHLAGSQGSGNLKSLVQANALLIVPSEVKSLPAGAEASAWLLDDNLPDWLLA